MGGAQGQGPTLIWFPLGAWERAQKKKKSNQVRRAKKASEGKKNEGPNKSICRTTHSK